MNNKLAKSSSQFSVDTLCNLSRNQSHSVTKPAWLPMKREAMASTEAGPGIMKVLGFPDDQVRMTFLRSFLSWPSRTRHRLWIVNGTMDANATTQIQRCPPHGSREAEFIPLMWVPSYWLEYSGADQSDASACRENSFTRRHDTRPTSTSVYRKIKETHYSSEMDPRGPKIVDWRTHWRIHAVERNGI